jgi:Response regulator containing CheY-like receiver, AAA-type ATPase, and DNA-binding domains
MTKTKKEKSTVLRPESTIKERRRMKEKILVIDDMANIAFIAKAILSREGYDVTTAYGYYDAGEKMARADFDLVLTDLDFGENKTGIDILKEVKKTDPTCPVIIHTGNTDYMMASDAKLFGAYDYMSKPVEQEKLLHTVRMALSHRTMPGDNANTDEYRKKNKTGALIT